MTNQLIILLLVQSPKTKMSFQNCQNWKGQTNSTGKLLYLFCIFWMQQNCSNQILMLTNYPILRFQNINFGDNWNLYIKMWNNIQFLKRTVQIWVSVTKRVISWRVSWKHTNHDAPILALNDRTLDQQHPPNWLSVHKGHILKCSLWGHSMITYTSKWLRISS